MLEDEFVEGLEQVRDEFDTLLDGVLVAVGREARDIREQDAHILELVRELVLVDLRVNSHLLENLQQRQQKKEGKED